MLFSSKSWHKIADHINELSFSSNNIAVVELNGKKICVAKHNDSYFAFAYKCPHAGGILAEGHIDAIGNIVCPLHRYKFPLQNGHNVSGEGYYLNQWELEIRGEELYVRI